MDTQKDEISELFALSKGPGSEVREITLRRSCAFWFRCDLRNPNDVFIIWTVDYDVRRSSLKRRKW